MPEGTCSLADCERPLKRKGYCYAHYMKNWRYGTPTPPFGYMLDEREPRPPMRPSTKRPDLTGRRYGLLLVIRRVRYGWECRCDCGRVVIRKAGGLNRGDNRSCGDRPTHHRTDSAGYGAAHDRVRRDRGRIGLHVCVNCGDPARHWSYNHDDPDELYAEGLSAHPVAYSLKPEHYSPRCVPCHKRYDLDRIDAADLPFAV